MGNSKSAWKGSTCKYGFFCFYFFYFIFSPFILYVIVKYQKFKHFSEKSRYRFFFSKKNSLWTNIEFLSTLHNVWLVKKVFSKTSQSHCHSAAWLKIVLQFKWILHGTEHHLTYSWGTIFVKYVPFFPNKYVFTLIRGFTFYMYE